MYAFECLIMKKLIKSRSNEAFCWQTLDSATYSLNSKNAGAKDS